MDDNCTTLRIEVRDGAGYLRLVSELGEQRCTSALLSSVAPPLELNPSSRRPSCRLPRSNILPFISIPNLITTVVQYAKDSPDFVPRTGILIANCLFDCLLFGGGFGPLLCPRLDILLTVSTKPAPSRRTDKFLQTHGGRIEAAQTSQCLLQQRSPRCRARRSGRF